MLQYDMLICITYTGFAFRFEHRKWNRGHNGLHQLGQPVAPSILFPVFKSEGEPGRQITVISAGNLLHRQISVISADICCICRYNCTSADYL